MIEQLFQKIVSSHIKDKQIIRSSLYGITKGKFCLMKLIHLDDEVTDLFDKWRVVDVVYLVMSRLNEQTMRWVEN